MKVHVGYTIDISDSWRYAINAYYGKTGMASRADVRQWYMTYGDSMDDELAELSERTNA